MKNQVVYQPSLTAESMNLVMDKIQSFSFHQFVLVLVQWVLSTYPFVALSRFVSLVLGEEVGALKAFNLMHAFVAFFAMLLLGGHSLLAQLGYVVWFALAAYLCKRDGWAEE